MPLFDLPKRTTRSADDKIAAKVNTAAKQTPITIKGSGGLAERITAINASVAKAFGSTLDQYECVTTEEALLEHCKRIKDNGIFATDTETTGLDTMSDKIVGFSCYTYGDKPFYVPLRHKSYITGIEVKNQLPVDVVIDILKDICNIPSVMFNANFDLSMYKNDFGLLFNCFWDCMLGSRLLNENEDYGEGGLKPLVAKYVHKNEASFKYEELFKGVRFDYVPIKSAYPYGAKDSKITLDLYDFQKQYLVQGNDLCESRGLHDVAWVMHNIEMPCVEPVRAMEEVGVAIDFDKASELHDKYTKLVEEAKLAVDESLKNDMPAIERFIRENPATKLKLPINYDSPVQLAVVMYDILGYESSDPKKPRGTGDDILVSIGTNFTKALTEYKTLGKLLGSYIDKLPECTTSDGRIHCEFKQYGADTGRMSSKNPNLQSIPSHNKEVRNMFKATDGYVMLSADYSQQEPKCLAALCRKQGDSQMYDAFMAGKDIYAEIASKSFHKPYEQCMEFAPDGSKNPPECKERRSNAKSILLGVLYGRGTASIAEQLGTTEKEARAIKESVFKGFPAIKQFEESSISMAVNYGFVTTVCGRKRRLPSMMLPDYEVKYIDGVAPDDDPLSFDNDISVKAEVPKNVQEKWISRLRACRFKPGARKKLYAEANEQGLWLIDNTRDKDVTKVVNARIQGSAADLTKLAIIKLHNDELLKEKGFRLLIPVHDEVIAECPEENVKEVSARLAKVMSDAAEQILEMPIKVDVEVSKCWYGESIEV